jgi:hypothetical protein
MLKSPLPRLFVDAAVAGAFADNLIRFSENLSESERAVLSAVLRAAMDPWSRSILEPPDLTPEEVATLDRIAGGRHPGE